jgi:ATP-dependent exoDNAse (exonuclease V) beta subunit
LRAASSEGREAEEARPKDAALDAVQVLTIHKAKGLDFAHVYVADLHRSLPPSKLPNCDVVHGEDRTSYAFFGSATPGYEEALAERDRVASAERVRTLYVAMTRAKERLVLSGPLPLAAAPAWDKCKTHMELLAHSFSPDTYAELVAAHAAGERTRATNGNVWILPEAAPPPRRRDASTGAHEDVSDVEHAVASLGAARAVAATRMARPWSTSASASAEHVAMPKHESATVIDRDDATAIGRAFHRMLEVFVAPTDPEKLRIVLLRFLESEAATVPSAQAVLQATLLLDRFLAGALHEKLMKLGTDILARELPVIALPAADDAATAFVSGTIDLVYRDPASGEIVIADYKTDALPTSETAARYAAQGRAYQRAIRDALELDRDPRFELWFVAEDRIEVVS